MQQFQGIKSGIATFAAAVTNGSTTTSLGIDTKGYATLQVCVSATTSNALTNNFSTLKLQQSDDDSTYADLSGAVGDTDFTIASAYTSTATPQNSVFNVSMLGKKRYIRCLFTPLTTQSVAVTYSLGRPATAPVTASQSGVENLVNIV